MQELLYTSVPRGLKPGSRGFCTVLSTQGMVAPLAAALEALSAYRPVFPVGHARVAENPVVYSHLKLQVAGKSWYVLSRVADYGLDYSQRTNKLAHHLVLDKSELPAAGPASLLRTSGIMRESWEGEPKIVPPKPISRPPSVSSGVCQAWKEMTGDAGWAGVLAESFLKDPARPVILLFEPGIDLRPLFDESLSLLPAERRWDVTFSTYFTGSSQGITCLWRGIVLGSKEATESLRFVNALRIDLTSTDIGRAEGGELVEAARKGVRPSARPTLPPKQSASHEQQPQRVVVLENIEEPTAPQAYYEPSDTETHATPVANYDHSLAPPRLTRSAFKFANAGRKADADDPHARASRGRKTLLLIAIALPLVCLISVGVFLFFKTKPPVGLASGGANPSSPSPDVNKGDKSPSAQAATSGSQSSGGAASPEVTMPSVSPEVGSPESEGAPPTDKPAIYTVELEPPKADLKAEGDDDVKVTGEGKQRTVTVAKPDSKKAVILIARLHGFREDRRELHPVPGASETLSMTLSPNVPSESAPAETKLTRLALPNIHNMEARIYKFDAPPAKNAQITCWIPRFEKSEGFRTKSVYERLDLHHNEGSEKDKTVANVMIRDGELIFTWMDKPDKLSDALKSKLLQKTTFCLLEIHEGKAVSHRFIFLPDPKVSPKQPPKGPSFKLIPDLKNDLGRVLSLADELKVGVTAKNVVVEFETKKWDFAHSKEKNQASILEGQKLAEEYGQERVKLEIKLKDAILQLSASADNHPYATKKTSLVTDFNSKVKASCDGESVAVEKNFIFTDLNTEEKNKQTEHTLYQWFLNSKKKPGGGKSPKEMIDSLKVNVAPIFKAASDLQEQINSAPKQTGAIKTQSQLTSVSFLYRVYAGDSESHDIEILGYVKAPSSTVGVAK